MTDRTPAVPERRAPGAAGRGLLGPRILAAGIIALAVVLVISALGIARGGGYSVVGPATIPLVVAIGLLVLGVVFAVRTTLLLDVELAEQSAAEGRATHWPTVMAVLGLLLIYGVALDGVRLDGVQVPGLGYVVATTLFVPATARVLGSQSLLRDLVVGAVVATVLYVGFTQYLGVRLPPGVLGLVF